MEGTVTGTGDGPEIAPPRSTRQRVNGVIAIVAGVLFLVSAFVLLASITVFRTFYIPSGSMEPTLPTNSHVVAMRASGADVQRGDIVIHRSNQDDLVGAGTKRELVKRVVALGGETVELKDCRVLIDGRPLDEPYLESGTCTKPGVKPAAVAVPAGTFYALGDNRGNSNDSRYSGPIPNDNITHRVVLTSGVPTAVPLVVTLVLGVITVITFLGWRRADD